MRSRLPEVRPRSVKAAGTGTKPPDFIAILVACHCGSPVPPRIPCARRGTRVPPYQLLAAHALLVAGSGTYPRAPSIPLPPSPRLAVSLPRFPFFPPLPRRRPPPSPTLARRPASTTRTRDAHCSRVPSRLLLVRSTRGARWPGRLPATALAGFLSTALAPLSRRQIRFPPRFSSPHTALPPCQSLALPPAGQVAPRPDYLLFATAHLRVGIV